MNSPRETVVITGSSGLITETVAEAVGLRAHRREPEATALTGLSHFAYGAAAGAAYAPLARAMPGPPALKGRRPSDVGLRLDGPERRQLLARPLDPARDRNLMSPAHKGA